MDQAASFFYSFILPISTFAKNALLVDPTRPAGYTATTANKNIKLNAIIGSSKLRSVIINGQLFKKGDMIGEYAITDIKGNFVRLRDPEGEIV